MCRQQLRRAVLLLSALVLVTMLLACDTARKPGSHASRTPAVPTAPATSSAHPSPSALTYADIGTRAITHMLASFYVDGTWKSCVSGCGAGNIDWGADALTYTLFLRWHRGHDASVIPHLTTLARTAPAYPSPCQSLKGCAQWSDVPTWDSIALGREYEATGLTNAGILAKEEAAFNAVDGAATSVYRAGACPGIRYQIPGGGGNHLKTLETDANYTKAALLLYRYTHNVTYLDKAQAQYAAIRQYFLDPHRPLYTVYLFDNGTTCRQVPGRFFASVNGDMIDNGLQLAQDTGDAGYRADAIATGQAVATTLSDANGVFADLQAENDIVEPLIEAMDELAADDNQLFARQWILDAASASASALAPGGTYSRFFDGPPQQGISTAWQANGGYALAVAVAALDPHGTPATTTAWTAAKSVSRTITTSALPASITFSGTGIALIGTLGERCCENGHARVFIDGAETSDTTGIWQNKSSSGRSIANTVLFAWRWPSAGTHTIAIYPGISNAKEGDSFIDITSYLVTP